MLQEVIRLHDEAVSALIIQTEKKKEITFKSPTGSGKTYMMADYMDRILGRNSNVVFLVSSLSKSNLAQQNYDKFCEYMSKGEFPHLKPFLISSEISGEESLFVPTDYNVYVLPRDLYKKGGRLMQGAMDNFLQTITGNLFGKGLNKKVYLIKDECHIETTNLNSLSDTYFTKVLNFSATPDPKKRQHPDVEITEEEAVNAKLIKEVEWIEDECDVADAVDKFEEIKDGYRNKLGVNPCLIIQISNKDKANQELEHIYSVLNKAEHQDLKWMLIVDKDKDCDTNDVFKSKKMPVSRWKDYAKEKDSTIDIIIFKMVITEGWDIPRACMLFQMRDSQSTQLDEQVVGRVRRNPRLLDFEKLDREAQELAMKAWIWGVKEKKKQKIHVASLFEEPSDITDKIRIKTTRLKTLAKKPGFDINKFMNGCSDDNRYSDIFALYRKFKKAEPEVQSLAFEYADKPCKWLKYTENLDAVIKESTKYICDYSKSMELSTDESGKVRDVSFPAKSLYTDNAYYENISDWVWKRDSSSDKFAFDSDAEREWASKLKDLAKDDSYDKSSGRVAQTTTVGKINPNAGQIKLDGSVEPNKINPTKKYLWGKNFLSNSEIKFEYCLDGIHTSYPDFVLKDCFGRIHLFEVKSVNVSGATSSSFDSEAYKQKMNELIKCYKQASVLTGHIFYLPVKKDDDWHITRLQNGEESTLTFDQFTGFVKTKPVGSTAPLAICLISSDDVAPSQRYFTHLPVYPLRAACGYFDERGSLPEEEAEGWIDVSEQLGRLSKGMFIVHAEGKSMEPKINDGDLCVFDSPVIGSRKGKIVLVKAKDKNDPAASSFTIKQYSSEKCPDDDGGWHHTRITLTPLNPDFKPIVLEADKAEEGEFQVYGELVQVIPQ